MSQFGEDKHIATIFGEVGFGSRKLCDIGARYEFSNSAGLIENHGFTGTLVDANPVSCDELRQKFPACKVLHQHVKPEDINSIVEPDTWFLSIDIDSTDFWVWANLKHRPALVVVEVNPLPGLFVAAMDCGRKDRDGYGMSLDAAKWLGYAKGYRYLGCTAANAFFLRNDLECAHRLEGTAKGGAQCGSTNNVFA